VDVRSTIPHRAYADALIEEFERRKRHLAGRSVRTIYIGGGTPSLWQTEQLARVLSHLRESATAGENRLVEICMEANPVDITRENLRAWTGAGVNRLSIGCQSFQPRVLRALNRNHTREQALSAVETAIEHGPGEVSLDLIFGNPEQTMDEWARDLDIVEDLAGLKHLSAYNLTIEPGTAFQRRRDRGRLAVPDDQRCFEMLEYLVERCEAMGLERYEVSNFARPGHRSRHNTLYWTGAEYLGLGVGAHSLRIESDADADSDEAPAGIYRHANPRATDEYLNGSDAESQTDSAADLIDRLSPREHLIERLFLGVRTRAGLDFAEVRFQFENAVDPQILQRAERLLAEMCEQGFLARADNLFIPTHLGLNVADGLAERFVQSL
jgi:oxygen-independent coproporphyrinogen-3 oxidase